LDSYLNFSVVAGGSTQIDIDVDGATGGTAVHQTILLEGVDLVTNTNGGGTFTDQQIITELLSNNQLITDS